MTARRAATFLAAAGALVMSSGVALMVAATPANAAGEGHTPVNICHATSSDTNPYVFITVDDDSKKFEAHLEHRNNPNKTWHDDTMWGGVLHAAGSPKPDLIDGLDGEITGGVCNQEGDTEDLLTNASVTFIDPSCDNGNVADFTTGGDTANVDFAITSGSKAPGADIVVTATAHDGYVFGGDTDEIDFPHTFGAVEDCTEVTPPTTTDVSPPKTKHTKTESTTVVTPTVVHAGLAGATVQDMRGEQGLALVFGGMLMMVAAGGLGLRLRGSASRI
jgi:hypothetical protein